MSKDLFKRIGKPSGKLGNILKTIGFTLISGVIANEVETTQIIEPDGVVRVIEVITLLIGAVTTLLGALMIKPSKD